MSNSLSLSPGSHLFLEPDDTAMPPLELANAQLLASAFSVSTARGLELLVSSLLHVPLPPTFVYWRNLARRYFTALCSHTNESSAFIISCPTTPELADLAESAPPMKGLEYLDAAALEKIWHALDTHVRAEISRLSGGTQAYLKACNPVWNLVGRVAFHLAENKRDPDYPFAFLATYTHRISEQGKVQHLPLGKALEEYAGVRNRAALASLLSPVQRAAEKSPLAREMLDTRAIFHPQAWQPAQAFAFLKQIPLFEQSGVTVRIPNWWQSGRPPRPQVNVRIGEQSAHLLGKDGLLDFNVELTIDGEPLSESEQNAILAATSGLILLKGKWIEVDKEKLQEVLLHWRKVQAQSGQDGVSLLQGLRLISGFDPGAKISPEAEAARVQWSRVAAGTALRQTLEEMQNPGANAASDPGPELRTQLRPYQRQGVHWLWFMNRLGLGACLADDMGLGKTLQIIALLLALKRKPASADAPRISLLIVPASLIANWKAEIQKFAPSLCVFYAHPSETSSDEIAKICKNPSKHLAGYDLTITSYALAARQSWWKEAAWNLLVLDEAQAIKNPSVRQTRAVKEINARCRIALSGTPIENRLGDLWSLFDFLCPGLLGNAKEFGAYVKNGSNSETNAFGSLRRLVRPYILRRLKTDKSIIADLPEKTEIAAFCPLSRQQAALYQQSVKELAERLNSSEIEGIQRRGIILAFLTRFKQICNHPSQWLGDAGYQPEASGKFLRLRELAEEIAARQEKVLVFSQYREIADPLSRYLAAVFGREGLILTGDIPVGRRSDLVEQFQCDEGPPFFVLSLKAGGTGLNLTAASHVIHFDRWWNPAVENQATDRAFRIGQKRNVMVHKFTCRGTVEEKIHDLITSKVALAENILGEGADRLLTEMSNSELLQFVALDINASSVE